MATTLPPDFKDFLQLLNGNAVDYLLVGGYAVAYYGYPRATADMDVWVAIAPTNAQRAVQALREFGFDVPELSPELFLLPDKVIRMGVPPVRIEVLTTISGVSFDECFRQRTIAEIDGIPVNLISLEHLKINKRASGRLKDLADLDYLP
jgi:hypothetical protein